MRPLPGQLGMFEDPPERETDVPRPPINGRAGTQLDHQHTVEIRGKGRRGVLVHGLYDKSQRLYQSGGETKKFIYHATGLVTLSREAWEQIADRSDWIEMIDHARNECWRIRTSKARAHLVAYSAGIGQRVGVAIPYWDILTGTGSYRKRGKP